MKGEKEIDSTAGEERFGCQRKGPLSFSTYKSQPLCLFTGRPSTLPLPIVL